MADRPKCPICGYKIRGENHGEGGHHAKRAPHTTGAKLSRKTKRINDHGKPTNVGDPSNKS